MYFATYISRTSRMFGSGKIGSAFATGAITRADGSPVKTKVVVYKVGYSMPEAEAWSDESGNWQIDNVDAGVNYFARIRDDSRALNGAVLDWIQPVPM